MAKNIKGGDQVMLNGSAYVVIEIDKDKEIANLQSPNRDATVYAVPWSEISKLDDSQQRPLDRKKRLILPHIMQRRAERVA